MVKDAAGKSYEESVPAGTCGWCDVEASTGRVPAPPDEAGTSVDLGAGRESVVLRSSSKEASEAPLAASVARSRVLRLIAREGLTFIRFGLSGLPGFMAAVGANILLVERLHWPKPLAYIVVVWLQMTSGFLMCRFVVFSGETRVAIGRAYLQFALSMGVIRIADWSLYTIAVELMKCPYVVAQISLSGLFIGLKFLSAKAIFRGRFKLHSKGTQ